MVTGVICGARVADRLGAFKDRHVAE
jgi:hypothetical protein